MNNFNKIPLESNGNSSYPILKLIKYNAFKKEIKINSKKSLFILFFPVVVLFICLIYYINYLLKIIKQLKTKNPTYYKKSKNFNSNLIPNDTIIQPYIAAQKDFCENQSKYINRKYEDEIILHDAKFKEFKFQIYVFKSMNFLIGELNAFGTFEFPVGNNMIDALKYYSIKYNILDNKDIFMIDIGGNVGWYPSLLGRFGYSIISFEAFEKNYYVEKKNMCLLNGYSNIIIVTKGLGAEEKICNYFIHKNNAGNGMVVCDKNDIINNTIPGFIKESEVEITTLNSFIPYLSNKNIALMKLDVEGNELKVLNGGRELITKYHIPFVVLEFTPGTLKKLGSEPKELIKLFVDNGYKISIKGFLSNNYLSVDEFFVKAGKQINCYFTHNSIL